MSVDTASPVVACRTTLPKGAPRVRLTATDDGQEKSWDLTDPVTLIGWGESCAVKLIDTTMSKVQCLIVNTGSAVLLRDVHSPKPTVLDGETVTFSTLSDGQVIGAGKIELTVHVSFSQPQSDADAKGALKMPGTVTLKDTQTRKYAKLHNAVSLIGRRQSLDVPLDDSEISPAHAAIFHIAGCPLILDLGSRKGITINGESATCQELRNDDRLRVGPFEVIIQLRSWKESNSKPVLGASEESSPIVEPPGPGEKPSERSEKKGHTPVDSLLTSTGSEAFEGFVDLCNMVTLMKHELEDGRDQLLQWEKDLQLLVDYAIGRPQPATASNEIKPKSDGTSTTAEKTKSSPEKARTESEAPKPIEKRAPLKANAASVPQPAQPKQYKPLAQAATAAKPKPKPEPSLDAATKAPAKTKKPAQTEAKEPTDSRKATEKKPADPKKPAAEKRPDGKAPAKPKPADTDSSQAALAAQLEGMPRTTTTADGKTVVNSVDLDPELAQKLRLMRRLEPTTDEVELLKTILEKEAQGGGKSAKKKSWWRR